jgi:GAG-pre-integrase domain/Zinc knuckle
MSVAEAIGRLRVSEESIKGRQQYKEEDEKLMLTRSQWEALSLKERKNGEGSDSKEGWHKGEYERKPYKKFDKSKIKCFNCSIYGHFASECRKPKKENVNLIEKEEESVLLMHELMNTQEVKCDIETINEKFEELCMGAKVKTEEKIWYLDLGASNHMMGCIKYLINLDTTIWGLVKLGDGSEVPIRGCGTVVIKGHTGEHRAITDVYYIPRLTSNIISLGQLEERGCKVQLEGGSLKVLDKNRRLIIRVQRLKNRLYTLNLELVQSVFENKFWIWYTKWHARYGHINLQSLKKMSKKKLVEELPRIECIEETCKGYLIGKQCRVPFPQEVGFRASETLKLLHEDWLLIQPLLEISTFFYW